MKNYYRILYTTKENKKHDIIYYNKIDALHLYITLILDQKSKNI